jgi:hypothetical protein
MDAKEFRKVLFRSASANPDAYQLLINTNEYCEYKALYQTLVDDQMLLMNTRGRPPLRGAELDAIISSVHAARMAVIATPEFNALIQ